MKHSELRHQPRHVNPRIQDIKEKYIGKILPVIVRDCLYDEMLEGIKTITMPQNNMSLDQSSNKDKEYRLIADEIRKKLYFDC